MYSNAKKCKKKSIEVTHITSKVTCYGGPYIQPLMRSAHHHELSLVHYSSTSTPAINLIDLCVRESTSLCLYKVCED